MVKLSELKDDVMVSFPESHYARSILELKKALEEKEYDALNECWYTVSKQEWKPDAFAMIENYLEDESCEIYDGWIDNAFDCIDEGVVGKIQKILDNVLGKKSVAEYWQLDERVELD